MKLYEAFFLTFLASLLAGAFFFLGLPFVWGLIASEGKTSFINSGFTIMVLVLYVIYVIIQFLLSSINLIQAIYFQTKGRLDIEDESISRYFFAAELALYLIVFVALAVSIREPEAMLFILVFSIPYALCCTNSVFVFRYFLRKLMPANE